MTQFSLRMKRMQKKYVAQSSATTPLVENRPVHRVAYLPTLILAEGWTARSLSTSARSCAISASDADAAVAASRDGFLSDRIISHINMPMPTGHAKTARAYKT
jgi:hypothetical protein